jgi:hypothetical protein
VSFASLKGSFFSNMWITFPTHRISRQNSVDSFRVSNTCNSIVATYLLQSCNTISLCMIVLSTESPVHYSILYPFRYLMKIFLNSNNIWVKPKTSAPRP